MKYLHFGLLATLLTIFVRTQSVPTRTQVDNKNVEIVGVVVAVELKHKPTTKKAAPVKPFIIAPPKKAELETEAGAPSPNEAEVETEYGAPSPKEAETEIEASASSNEETALEKEATAPPQEKVTWKDKVAKVAKGLLSRGQGKASGEASTDPQKKAELVTEASANSPNEAAVETEPGSPPPKEAEIEIEASASSKEETALEQGATAPPQEKVSWKDKAAKVAKGLLSKGQGKASEEASTDVATYDVEILGNFEHSVLRDELQPTRRVYKINTETHFRKWLQVYGKGAELQSVKYKSVDYRLRGIGGHPKNLDPCTWIMQNVYLYEIKPGNKIPQELLNYTMVTDVGDNGARYYVVENPAAKLKKCYQEWTNYKDSLIKISISTDETVEVEGDDGKKKQKIMVLPAGDMIGPYVLIGFEPQQT